MGHTSVRRNPPKRSTCCKIPRPMSRLYAKVKPERFGGGNATLKAVGWICWEHNRVEIDSIDDIFDKRGE